MSSKSILVTGCSVGGIGAAIAINLARHGHTVFATARNTSKIPEELSRLPNVTVIPLDVSSTTSISKATKVVNDSGYGLDVLVNDAGIGYAMPILDIDVEEAQRVHNTNVWGPVRTVQAFSNLLIKSRGRVVNMSTVGAVLNMPWISAYSSSKAALTLLSETLRLELSPFGVSVVTIMGGIITSKFHDNDSNSNFKAPPTSRYSSIQNVIAGWASGKSKPTGMTAENFAEHVLRDIVGKGKGGVVWRGPNAGSVNFAKWLMPTSFIDSSLSKGQGLEELEKNISDKQ
ncbi:NAD(P)-binding protein [Xylariaceae sp. AK1471]|nr:NAD(P)-binding protein [Xylariaceae sp. AK1471]